MGKPRNTTRIGRSQKGKWWAVEKDVVKHQQDYGRIPIYHKVKDSAVSRSSAGGRGPDYVLTECGRTNNHGLLLVEVDFRNHVPGRDCVECWQGRVLRNLRLKHRREERERSA